ncbi:IS3 family transposase [Burkholderia metallica]|uniref:IS3 family transposase n=1 Tax=Burkholderia metallica TaxID=488729 RepID=UPI00384DCEB8
MGEVDQRLMRRIDELHLEFPFASARMLARLLRREGYEVGRRQVRTPMKRMGVSLHRTRSSIRRAAKSATRRHSTNTCGAAQLAEPAVSCVVPVMHRALRRAARIVWGVYCWLLVALFGPAVWALIAWRDDWNGNWLRNVRAGSSCGSRAFA